MAKLTEQTEAILQRLKDEGDLVRNSGTNSIRSVKVEMGKFTDLFTTINSNVEAQTQLMRQSMGLAQDAVRKAETKEQLSEVDTSYTDKIAETEKEKNGKDFADKVSDSVNGLFGKVSDGIRDNLSLTNVAMAGAGLFVGYNLLKGFVNEQTGGGFDDFIEGFKGFGPNIEGLKTTLGNARIKLDEFSTINVEEIKESLKTMNKSIKDMLDPETGSLSILVKNMETISSKFAKFAEYPLGTMFSAFIGAISGLHLASAGLRWWFVKAKMDLENGTRPINGVPWWKRMLGIKDDGGVKPPPPRSQLTDKARLAQNSRLVKQFPNLFELGKEGGLIDRVPDKRGGFMPKGTGGYSSQATINAALQSGLTGANGAAYKFITGVLKKVGIPVLVGVTAYQILTILSDDLNYPDKEAKAVALGPVIGSVIGGIAGAIIAGALASMTGVGLGWGTFVFGIVGGIAGSTTVGSTKLGYYVAKAALAEPAPAKSAGYEGMTQKEIMASHGFNEQGQFIGNTGVSPADDVYKYMDPDYIQKLQEMDNPKITFPNTTPPGLLEAQREQAKNIEMLEERRAAHEAGQKKRLEEEQKLQETMDSIMKDNLTPSSFNLDRGKLADMFAAGGGGMGIVNAPVNNNISPVNISNGGNVVNEFTYAGGSMSSGSLGLSIYGVTSGLVST